MNLRVLMARTLGRKRRQELPAEITEQMLDLAAACELRRTCEVTKQPLDPTDSVLIVLDPSECTSYAMAASVWDDFGHVFKEWVNDIGREIAEVIDGRTLPWRADR